MNTSVKRRPSPATPRPPRHPPSAPELAWLYVALGLGIAAGIFVAAAFALDPWGPKRGARAERAATPVLAAATPAPGPASESPPAAEVPEVAKVPSVEDEKPEPPAPAPA